MQLKQRFLFTNKNLSSCLPTVKKISRGKCKNIGDIDCWGYEATPNLSERKKSHTEDISNIESVQNKIDEMEGIVRDLNELSSEDKYAMKDVLRKTIQCLGLK